MDPIQALLLQANQRTNSFPPSSRYQATETILFNRIDGQQIIHLKRRFVPQQQTFTSIQEHIVQQGERLDNITHQYLGDPELFWQLCDANNVMHPLQLTKETGNIIRISYSSEIIGDQHV